MVVQESEFEMDRGAEMGKEEGRGGPRMMNGHRRQGGNAGYD